jgi:ribose transport system ATP-binding protein
MEMPWRVLLQDYFGLDLPKKILVGTLSTGKKQILHISRALIRKPKLLVFDEPTAALVRKKAEIMSSLIRTLRREGITIVYFSHYLNEIEALCDRVRNSRVVETLKKAEASAKAIEGLMIERDLGEMFPNRQLRFGETIMAVRLLTAHSHFDRVDSSLRRGEVLRMMGLLFSGAKHLVRSLSGLEQPTEPGIDANGAPAQLANPERAVRHRLALVLEDRRSHGVGLDLGLSENFTRASSGRLSRLGLLSRRNQAVVTEAMIKHLDILTSGRDALVRTLSGGNRQKFAVAKAFKCLYSR